MHTLFLIISLLLGVVGITPYIRDILRGSTRPNIAGWMTWTLLTAVATVAEFGAGEVVTGLVTLFATLQTLTVVLLGLKYGYAEYHWSDRVCQAGAVVGLLIWITMRNADAAVLLMVGIDALGAIPTLRHAWEKPYEETAVTFAISSLGGLASVAALTSFTTTSLAYPIYLTLANTMLASFILVRRAQLSVKAIKVDQQKEIA